MCNFYATQILLVRATQDGAPATIFTKYRAKQFYDEDHGLVSTDCDFSSLYHAFTHKPAHDNPLATSVVVLVPSRLVR